MEPVADNESAGPQGSRKRCPHCGASNKFDAQWCGQCLERFEEPRENYEQSTATSASPEADVSDEDGQDIGEEEAAKLLSSLADDTLTNMKVVERSQSTVPKPTSPQPATPTTPGTPSKDTTTTKGAFRVGEEGITWTCLRCDTVNPMENSQCDVCGTKFAEAIQPEKTEVRRSRDPNTAAIVSLALPGAGHAYLGMWPEGIARGVIGVWVLAVTIFAALQGTGMARIMALLFGLVTTALWGVSAHDAYREASGMSRYVILKRKYFLYVVLGLLLLSIIMIFATAIAANR